MTEVRLIIYAGAGGFTLILALVRGPPRRAVDHELLRLLVHPGVRFHGLTFSQLFFSVTLHHHSPDSVASNSRVERWALAVALAVMTTIIAFALLHLNAHAHGNARRSL